MERYRDGDAGAFGVVYGRHRGGVFRYMLRQCGNRDVAEELFQEVWMNLIRARESYVVQAKFSTYLYRLAHNRLIDHYRPHAGRGPGCFEKQVVIKRIRPQLVNNERFVEMFLREGRLLAGLDHPNIVRVFRLA